ncbi:MAG: ABC transporter permease, partial [Deltaproteobacteria bacterium]|nr:ABC transporter permease [Deltaproteobacteria bacterium]
MSVWTTFRLALRALWRNKVRTLLTMLGIVFGIGAVIAMVAGGQGAQQAVKDVFANLGTNVLQVMNGNSQSFGAAGGAGSRQSLTWKDLQAIRDEIPSIKYAAPLMSTKSQVASEDQNWNTSIYGTTAVWFKIRNWDTSHGSVFDEDTGNTNAKVAVIGQTVATQLYGTADPVGQALRINGQPYEVVGVLIAKGAGPMGDMDDIIVVPVKTYQQKLERAGVANYIKGQLLVQVGDEKETDRTIAAMTSLLRDRHKLDSAQDDDFRIRNPAEFAKAQQDSTQRIATLLAIVAGVSLFVGGIGVMNIMLVSVIERTREIGIRMAVGAKPGDVMTQFLVESLVLAAVGGGLGLAMGYGAAYWMADYFGWKMFFPMGTAGIEFGVAGGVGVVFG